MFEFDLAGHRTDSQLVFNHVNTAEFIDIVDINEYGGIRKAHIKACHQALAAGQYGRIGPMLLQTLQSIIDGLRLNIAKCWSFHGERVVLFSRH